MRQLFVCFVAPFIFKLVDRHLALILFSILEALASIAIPNMPSLATFFVATVIGSLSGGIYNTAQTAWMIDIWRHESRPFILSQHFFYAVGSLIAPLLLEPFLADEAKDTGGMTTPVTASSTVTSNSTGVPEDTEFKLHVPFGITAALILAGVVYQIVLFIIFRRRRANKGAASENTPAIEKEQVEDTSGKTPEGWTRSYITIVVLSCVSVAFLQAMELVSMNFISLFAQYSEVGLSEAEGSRILSALTYGYAGGRLAGILIVLKCPPHWILLVSFILSTAGNTILFAVGGSNETWLWVGGMVIGLGFSTAVPAFFAYLEKYIFVGNFVSAAILGSVGVMMTVAPLILGSSVEENAKIFNYCNYGSIAVAFVAFVVLFMMTYWRQRKNS